MRSLRARALSYWRASRRLLLKDERMGLTSTAADIALIGHALDPDWPRLAIAATDTLVLARRRQRAADVTSAGRSRSRGRRHRPRAD